MTIELKRYMADVISMSKSYAMLQDRYMKRVRRIEELSAANEAQATTIAAQAARIAELEAASYVPVEEGVINCASANRRTIEVLKDGKIIDTNTTGYFNLGTLRICQPASGGKQGDE